MVNFIFAFLMSVGHAVPEENCLEISKQQMAEWNAIKPDMPALTSLWKAKNVIDTERRYSLKLGNDKTAHCYLGCRISDETNTGTAQYVAWQKEYQDATDCNQKSLFEIADYEATLKGARRNTEKAAILSTKKLCARYCKKVY